VYYGLHHFALFQYTLLIKKKKKKRLLLNLPMYPKRDGLVGQGSYKEFS
jgi:hypothetical protein